jgi:ethanolamine utilization protein EutQ
VRQLFTAADIRRLASEHKSELLVLGPADLITPEAVDVAKEMGVRLVREDGASAPPGAGGGVMGAAPSSPPPLRVVRGAGASLEVFGVGLATPGTDVRLKDVVTSSDGAPMAAGYMTLDAPPASGGEFPWRLSYDEIDVVLEGELVITRGREVVRGGPGDVIYIPKGSSITFGTPRHTRFVYVAFPADWNTAGG